MNVFMFKGGMDELKNIVAVTIF